MTGWARMLNQCRIWSKVDLLVEDQPCGFISNRNVDAVSAFREPSKRFKWGDDIASKLWRKSKDAVNLNPIRRPEESNPNEVCRLNMPLRNGYGLAGRSTIEGYY